jgi:hypothetical protein
VFVDTLPTTSTSKIRKRALSVLAAADAALVFDLREGKTRKALGEGGGA